MLAVVYMSTTDNPCQLYKYKLMNRKSKKHPFSQLKAKLGVTTKSIKFKHIALFTIAISVILLFYLNATRRTSKAAFIYHDEPNINSSRFLVDTLKCKILDVDPFDLQVKPYHEKIEYLPCTTKKLLTYVTKNNNVATLHINTKVLHSYQDQEGNISCCYSELFRKIQRLKPDDHVIISKKRCFKNNVTLGTKPVKVICSTSKKTIYENVHAPVTITENVKEKLQFTEDNNFFSVLLIGIDSVSRLNFIRSLPNSHKFLMDNNWISFIGYNKIDDNTYPNVMAILTGNKQANDSTKCKTNVFNGLNGCDIIWYDLRDTGYVTAYAEDEIYISTFNLNKKGFRYPPTDYYFRPYLIASQRLKTVKYEGLSYCTGPETTGERVLNVASDFATTFLDYPNFGLFWMNSFSHNTLNMVSMMDDKIKHFLQEISNNGVLNNSFVIFLSDHGLRCTDFRRSSMGWLEERLPFFFLWVPHRFRRQFPKAYANVKNNAHKLTNPYDLYMTLQHLIVLSGFNYMMKKSVDCPKCRSLFTEIENERSCKDAGINQHWCTCIEYTPVDSNKELIKNASDVLINEIHQMIDMTKGHNQCARFLLHKIIATSISQESLLIVIETRPKAVFEATIFFNGENATNYYRVDGVSRIDKYQPHSWCVSNSTLKKYCYCT